MERVDIFETEADFIEFRFSSDSEAEAAEKHFPTDFVRSSAGVIEYRASPSAVESIRERLEAAGLSWNEAESALTEDEMWPVWPGDGETGPAL